MTSTFFGLNISRQGLNVSRAGMETVNHNISNAETEGYTRQVTKQRATTPLAINTGKGMIGTGAEVYAIKQIRDSYLDSKYRTQSGLKGEYSTKTSISEQLQTIVNSAADVNFSSVLGTFYDSIQDLSNNPSDESYRTILKESAITYAQYFNETAEKMYTYQKDLNYAVIATVGEINSIGVQIQGLNRQIFRSELDGSDANDLRDQRNLLVDDLSKLINTEVDEYELNGVPRYRVKINGQILVDHYDVFQLDTEERKANIDEFFENNVSDTNNTAFDTAYNAYVTGPPTVDISRDDFLAGVADGTIIGTTFPQATATTLNTEFTTYKEDYNKYLETNSDALVDVVWEHSGVRLYNEVNFNNMSGTLKGYIDMRDGNCSNDTSATTGLDQKMTYKGVPYYLNQMNKFVQTFSQLMNEGISYNGTQISKSGGFADGYNSYGETGIGLFSYKTDLVSGALASGKEIDYSKITARNFNISAEIEADIKNMATTYDVNADSENNDLLLDIISLRHNNKSFSQGEIDDFMTALTSQLAVDTKQAQSFEKSEENIILSISNQKLSVSGVSLNEEMTSMIKHQKVYAASAKMISALDEIYNITINRIGNT